MGANSVVNGNVNGAVAQTNTGTFQTGDTINGSTNNTLNVTSAAAAAQTVIGTLSNVGTINVRNVGAGVLTIDNVLTTGLNNFNVTQGVTGVTTTVANGSATTVYGNSAGVADNMNIAFAGATTGRALQLNLGGAGTATTTSNISYTGGATTINAISLATTGANNVLIGGTTSVRAVAITGNGNNTVNLAAGAVSATASVAITAADATGDNTINIGANRLFTGSTITGSTGEGITTLGLTIQAAAPLAPTFTNIDGLSLNAGSNGTLISAAVNTSITDLTILDVGTTNTNAYSLLNFSGINSVTWGTTGGVNNVGGALTLTGSGALAYTFANQAAAAFVSGNNLTLNAQTLTGYTSLTINTAGGLASNGTFTLGGVTGTALQSFAVTNAASGVTTLNTITSTNALGNGTLSLVDLSGVAGQSSITIDANSLAAASVINGSVGVSNITVNATQTGTTTLSVNLLNANNVYTATGAVNQVVTAGTGNNTITTGSGIDVITVGAGSNTISAGAGINTVVFGSNAASGAADVYVVSNAFAAGNQTTLSNWTVASPDVIQFSDAGTGAVLINGNAGDVTAGAAVVETYAGAALTVGLTTTALNAVGLGATTAAALQATLRANVITLGTAATAGETMLIEYLSTDGTVHIAGVAFTAATTSVAATVTDIVITGQASALTAADLFFIA